MASGVTGRESPTITLGTKEFTEQFVLGELYRQALAAKGYKVKLRKDIEGHVGNIFRKLGIGDAPDYHWRVVAVLTFLRAPGVS